MIHNHNEYEVLHSPFNPQIHKETFVNYLEVVILENGTIEYAVPSHQTKVTDIIAEKYNIRRGKVADLCPQEFYFSYSDWLCREANAIMVWNNFYKGNPNDRQLESLLMLIDEKLYHGRIEIDRIIKY